MNLLKILPLSLLFIASFNAKADLLLKCSENVSLESCSSKVEKTVEGLGCEIDKSATDCFFGLIDDPNSDLPDVNIPTDTVLCSIKSSNCSHARDMMFTVSESCGDYGTKVKIPRNAGVTNNYWKGLFGPYSRIICRY